MSHLRCRISALLVGLIALTGIGLSATAASAAVRPGASSGAVGTTASVTLVHGVRGLLADVVVDGKTVLQGFAYERASSPMDLPSGTHRVEVYTAGQAHTQALLDVKLTVKGGQVLTAAVGFDATGAPKVYVFDNRLSAAAHAASSIVVRNVSQGTAPQVWVDGKEVSGGLKAGAQLVKATKPGSHTVGLKVNGAWLLTNQPVRAASGKAMVVYVVGRQSAKSVALVADSVTPSTVAAAAVNSGGLPPQTTSRLVPAWLAGGVLLVGVVALSLLMMGGRRRFAAARAAGPGAALAG